MGRNLFSASSRENENVAWVRSFAYRLLAITVVFILIIAWFSGRALSRPIIKLTDAAERISVGELDMEIRTRRKDEIGDCSGDGAGYWVGSSDIVAGVALELDEDVATLSVIAGDKRWSPKREEEPHMVRVSAGWPYC